jgi:hypothetical protein
MSKCDACGTKIEDGELEICANTDDGLLLCPKCYTEAQNEDRIQGRGSMSSLWTKVCNKIAVKRLAQGVLPL